MARERNENETNETKATTVVTANGEVLDPVAQEVAQLKATIKACNKRLVELGVRKPNSFGGAVVDYAYSLGDRADMIYEKLQPQGKAVVDAIKSGITSRGEMLSYLDKAFPTSTQGSAKILTHQQKLLELAGAIEAVKVK